MSNTKTSESVAKPDVDDSIDVKGSALSVFKGVGWLARKTLRGGKATGKATWRGTKATGRGLVAAKSAVVEGFVEAGKDKQDDESDES